jgi:putative PIN family toxin of toxin-antitoxin system
MRAERVVVDTNVLISALLLPESTPRKVIDELASRAATLLFSDETFAELAMRLAKPKFDAYRTREQMDGFLDWLVELAEWVEPNLEVEVCRDRDDDKFLALALSAEADCLIRGDTDLLTLHPLEGVPSLSPAAFLEACRKGLRE